MTRGINFNLLCLEQGPGYPSIIKVHSLNWISRIIILKEYCFWNCLTCLFICWKAYVLFPQLDLYLLPSFLHVLYLCFLSLACVSGGGQWWTCNFVAFKAPVGCPRGDWKCGFWEEGQNSEAFWSFPGGSVVRNLPANAVDVSAIPALGRSRTPRRSWATHSSWACELQLLRPMPSRAWAPLREAPTVRGPYTTAREQLHLLQLERARAVTKNQHSHK